MSISVKSFITAIIIIFVLMIVTYVLTFIIPGGQYVRTDDGSGNLIITMDSEFHYVDGGIPFWKWILSPFLVLGAPGSALIIAVIAFLLVIGGIFECLSRCNLMQYMLDKIAWKYGAKRYTFLFVITFFFMAMGALIGSFEECIPLVPIVVVLAVSMGWDKLTGLGMSLLAVGCGFASGVCNPFTVGVAQGLAGLPMFSGIWLRALSFVLIFLLLWLFIRLHAKKVEKPISSEITDNFRPDTKLDKGLKVFAIIIAIGLATVLSSSFITFLQDFTLYIVALMFLVAGIAAPLAAGMKGKELLKAFGKGLIGFLPVVLMILMASSIKYTLDTANVLDTVLHSAVAQAATMPRWTVILFIYAIVLVMNFFIGSGSAKAFMLIPLIVPMAQIFGIPAQLCIVAFAFGDGFSNVLYPTNAALLVALGLTDESYGEWFKWSIKFQLLNLVLTSGLLLLGLAVGYGA
ncbi:MAG: TIGR00366 family protein [Lachnospiraceae bacterium]|nr:TIGR00366 family protein [Lachnospiraceae bacterium]